MSDKKIIFRCTFPFGAPSEAERSIEDFKSRGRTVEFDVAGVTEPVYFIEQQLTKPVYFNEDERGVEEPMVDCPTSRAFPLGRCKQSQQGLARDMAGWKTPAVTEPVAPPAPKKSEPAPTFLYAPRTFDVKVWGADKGCAFKDTVASMAQPWDGRGP